MSTKIHDLSELANVIGTKEKVNSGIYHFAKSFRIGQLLQSFSDLKEQGYSFLSLIIKLILIRLGGMNISSEGKTVSKTMDDNTLYRLLNNAHIDWRKMLMSFAMQFIRIVKRHGEMQKDALLCFIADDTLLEKTGKIIEGISKVNDHVKGGFVWGFKMLSLGYYDGKMLIPIDVSLHRESRENNYGLSKKEQKRQHKTNNSKGSFAAERKNELDKKKTDILVEMIKRAVRKGLKASYVLMDSWFLGEEVIKAIRGLKKGTLHVVGVCKMDRRKFTVGEKEYNSHTIIRINESKGKVRNNKKYKSQYIVVEAFYKGVPVKLFYVKYKRSKNWTLLLSTDLRVGFNRVMEIYQIRWSIEVLFKECKQYLGLGKSQNTHFNGQIADTTLALITYTILSLGKRFGSYETIGDLFRANQQEMLVRTISERIMEVILQLIMELLEFLAIDIEETMRTLAGDVRETEKLMMMLKAVNQYNATNLTKNKAA